MRCAMEAIAQSAKNKAEIEQAEKERIANLPNKCKEHTLAFVHNYISSRLDKRIKKGETPSLTLKMDSFIQDGYIFYGLIEQEKYNGMPVYYANKQKSEVVSKNLLICWELMVEELSKYCYKVETCDYRYKTYGLGNQLGKTVFISPAPTCM